jgi:class 3 adenylate cyclase
MSSNAKKFVFLITLLGIICSAFTFYQQRQLHLMKLKAQESNVRKQIPLIQERSKPFNVASALILNQLNKIERLNSDNAEVLKRHFVKTFGDEIKLILLDSNHKVMVQHGLDMLELSDFQQFLTDFYGYHKFTKPVVSSHSKNFLRNYFEETFAYNLLPNMINIGNCRFKGTEGLGLVATLIKPTTGKRVLKEFAMTIPTEALESSAHGSALMFIPASAFESIEFLRKNFTDCFGKDLSKCYFGSKSELNDILSETSSELAQEFSARSEKDLQGIFFAGNHFHGFARVTLSDFSPETKFIYFAIKTNRPGFSGILLPAVVLPVLNIVLFAFFAIKFSNSDWQLSLSRKFICMALCACALPLAGLVYQSYLGYQFEQTSQHREIFQRLEEKILAVENNNQTKVSDLITAIRVFNEKIRVDDKLDLSKVQQLAYNLRDHFVIQVYIADQDGEIYNFNTKKDWVSDKTKAGTVLVKALLRFVQQSLKFKSLKKRKQGELAKETLIIESVADAMGVKTLYKLAIRQFELIPFKLINGAVWACTNIQRDADMKQKRLIMYAVNRTPMMADQIEEIQKQQSQEFPELLFMKRSFMNIEKVAPNLLETKPEFLTMLKSLNNGGGVINHSFEMAGQKIFIAGRRINDMDWTCLALARVNSGSRLSNWAILSTMAVVGYLGLLILLLSVWIRQIFLKPVQELTRNATRIAGGDYEVSLAHLQDDEIGFLSKNFTEMAADLKEKEFLDRFLSDIARDAISGNKTTRATKIEATVLFSDIRNFTTLSEQHEPEEIVQMLNSYMTLMETIIEKHGGSIEKFIGDAIMALFLPRMGLEHPAVRAVKAAIEMIEALEQYNADRKRQNRFTISNGAGLAHGELLMGTMGNLTGRRDYTVTGPTVNIAAEMEKLSKQTSKLPIVLCPNSAKEAGKAGFKHQKIEAGGEITAYEIKQRPD